MLNAADISAALPHGSGMSLLERVVSWCENTIVCEAVSHDRESNPLHLRGALPVITLVEYAAQAAAVHSSLVLSGMGRVRPAYIGALKKVSLFSEVIPRHTPVLKVHASVEMVSDAGAIYSFEVVADSVLISGRMVLVIPTSV